MMSLEEIFNQASSYRRSTRLTTPEYVSYIYRGIKIIKDNETGGIKILNTHNSAIYKEFSKEEYTMIMTVGWRLGVYEMCVRNYIKTLDLLKMKIKNEINGRNNQKHYNALKDYRDLIMSKYSDVLRLKKEV